MIKKQQPKIGNLLPSNRMRRVAVTIDSVDSLQIMMTEEVSAKESMGVSAVEKGEVAVHADIYN